METKGLGLGQGPSRDQSRGLSHVLRVDRCLDLFHVQCRDQYRGQCQGLSRDLAVKAQREATQDHGASPKVKAEAKARVLAEVKVEARVLAKAEARVLAKAEARVGVRVRVEVEARVRVKAEAVLAAEQVPEAGVPPEVGVVVLQIKIHLDCTFTMITI